MILIKVKNEGRVSEDAYLKQKYVLEEDMLQHDAGNPHACEVGRRSAALCFI
jgi:hypothetical protein